MVSQYATVHHTMDLLFLGIHILSVQGCDGRLKKADFSSIINQYPHRKASIPAGLICEEDAQVRKVDTATC